MAQPFKPLIDEHIKENNMRDFYNSLDCHLKAEYEIMRNYRGVFIELGETAYKLGDSELERNLGYTIATIDKFLYGNEEMRDVLESLPTFNRVLEDMRLETILDLAQRDDGDLIY